MFCSRNRLLDLLDGFFAPRKEIYLATREETSNDIIGRTKYSKAAQSKVTEPRIQFLAKMNLQSD